MCILFATMITRILVSFMDRLNITGITKLLGRWMTRITYQDTPHHHHLHQSVKEERRCAGVSGEEYHGKRSSQSWSVCLRAPVLCTAVTISTWSGTPSVPPANIKVLFFFLIVYGSLTLARIHQHTGKIL